MAVLGFGVGRSDFGAAAGEAGAGAGAVGTGALALLAPAMPPPAGAVASLAGAATCSTVDVTGGVASATVPPSESAVAGEVHTARVARVASVTPMKRDRVERSAWSFP